IMEHIPAPLDTKDEPLQFQVTLLDYNKYVGRVGIGRVFRGKISVGQQVIVMKKDGSTKSFRITKLFGFIGLKRVEIQEAHAGDVVALSGLDDINVGETICPEDHPEPLPLLRIDEPTLQMTFHVNNSPFAGREGKYLTSRQIEERLMTELETDDSLRVEPTHSPDACNVSGGGELYLTMLVENMRQQRYELQLFKPMIILKSIYYVMYETDKHQQIVVPAEYTGSVMQSLG